MLHAPNPLQTFCTILFIVG